MLTQTMPPAADIRDYSTTEAAGWRLLDGGGEEEERFEGPLRE